MEEIFVHRLRRLTRRHLDYVQHYLKNKTNEYHNYFDKKVQEESCQRYSISLGLHPGLCYLSKEELLLISYMATAPHCIYLDGDLSNEVCFAINFLKNLKRGQ